jgi:hypothetical protein
MRPAETLLCQDCGKTFLFQDVANSHASKTGHFVAKICDMKDSSMDEGLYDEKDSDRYFPHLSLRQAIIQVVQPGFLTTKTFKVATSSTAYSNAQDVGLNDYQCGWSGCGFYGTPNALACHVLDVHPGSDWTLEGFKCGWAGCPVRVRLHRGLHQHCLDTHIPPLAHPFWSHGSKDKVKNGAENDGEAEQKIFNLMQEADFYSKSNLQVELKHEADHDTKTTTDFTKETEAVLPSPQSVLNPTQSTSYDAADANPGTLTPSRGGLRHYLPNFSNLSSPFTSLFSSGKKRRLACDSDKESSNADITPTKGGKRMKIT